MITGVMLTCPGKFHKAIRTLRAMQYLEAATLVVPQGTRSTIKRMIEGMHLRKGTWSHTPGPFPSEINYVEHDIPLHADGRVPYGALREIQFEHGKRWSRGPRDLVLMIDDDVHQIQGIDLDYLDEYNALRATRNEIALKDYGCKWKSLLEPIRERLREKYGFRKLAFKMTEKEFRDRISRVGAEIQRYSDRGGFFTFATQALSRNPVIKQKRMIRAVRYTGIVGFTHDTPNPFDSTVNAGEDYMAQGTILCDLNLPLIADPSCSVHMEIKSEDYQPGGSQFIDRLNVCHEIVDRFYYKGDQVFNLQQTTLGNIPNIRVTNSVTKKLREETTSL